MAGLLLAGCSFTPHGSSSDEDRSDATIPSPSPLGDAAAIDAVPAPDATPPVLLETLTVPSTGEVVQSTLVLEAGASFRLVASGVVTIREGFSGDADYYWSNDFTAVVADDAGGVDLGLAIDDLQVDGSRSPDWGPPSGEHTYETIISGTGALLSAQFHDPNFDNNSGSLSLEIHGPPR